MTKQISQHDSSKDEHSSHSRVAGRLDSAADSTDLDTRLTAFFQDNLGKLGPEWSKKWLGGSDIMRHLVLDR